MVSVVETDLAGSLGKLEILVYALVQLCNDSCFICSAIFQGVNHSISIRKKSLLKPYFRSFSSWFICYPFFIYDCLISAQKIVTHILPSVQNSLQIHTSILQISVPSFSSASKSSEAVAERLKAHPRLDPASEMRYYGFHVFFSCKSNTL